MLQISTVRKIQKSRLPARRPAFGASSPASCSARRSRREDAQTQAQPEAALRDALARAEATNNQLREVIDMLPQGVVVLDTEGRYVLWNKQYAEIYRKSADLFEVGVKLEDTLRIGISRGDYPEAAGREEEWLADRLAKLYHPKERHEQWLADGRCILIDELLTTDGGVVGLRVDITALKEREASFRLLFDANPLPMFVIDKDNKTILAVNAAALEHYGHERSELLSKTLYALHHANDHEFIDQIYSGRSPETEGRTWTHVISNGEQIDVAIYSRSILHGRAPTFLCAAIDITERKRAEAKVAYLAHHDALTGLANRVCLRNAMDDLLSTSKRAERGLATLCIDLDNFKVINDTMGHAAGDSLLQQLAQRINANLRKNDIAARLGGDEFALVLANMDQPVEVSFAAQRLLNLINQPYQIQGQQVIVSASVGVAMFPADGETSEALLKSADLALYQAKGDGKGAYRYFEAEMNARVQARRKLESDLHRAFREELLEVHYQPLVSLACGSVSGFEALLRWQHPERGFIPPSEFIPVAEECGLIGPISDYVLRKACCDATAWPAETRLAVNMSPHRFRIGNVFNAVSEALALSGLPPDRLELEITETLLLENSDVVLSTLHALRSLGVRISMDDFGTGYSSLSYLRTFPFDKIKIDRSFIRDICTRSESQAIVRAIMGLGSSLGMTITAEGIETEAEQEFLKALGCAEGQGFLFSRARPSSEIATVLTGFAK